jgi:class 3 adenylate cyclase
MESVAVPGGVMLSESTARLVGDAVTLSEPEGVRIKGRSSTPTRLTTPRVWRCTTSIATRAYAAVGAAMP